MVRHEKAVGWVLVARVVLPFAALDRFHALQA